MKKLIYAVCAVLLCVSVFLSACSGCKTPPEQPEEPAVEKIDFLAEADRFRIVRPSAPTQTERQAAQELNYYIAETTGKNLRIVDDSAVTYDENEYYISVGDTTLLEDANLDLDYSLLNYDGFFISFVGNMILIDGENDRGTLYGSYDFLEKFFGVRFLTIDHSHTPQLSEVKIPKKDIVEAPDFMFRAFIDFDTTYNADFGAKMRYSNGYQYTSPQYGGSSLWYNDTIHCTLEYVPPAVYADKHPDWYSNLNFSANTAEICFSNGITDEGKMDDSMEESVFKAMLGELQSRILEKPAASYYMIGQMDSPAEPCTCAKCLKGIEKYGGRSGLQIVFFNELVRKVNEWAEKEEIGHDINVATFAYTYSEMPPVQNGQPFHPAVVCDEHLNIRFAPINLNYGVPVNDERQDDVAKTLFEGWKVVTDNLMVWDYYMNVSEHYWYVPYIGMIKPNYEYYKSLGIKFVYSQPNHTESQDYQARMMSYVASKLMWDTTADAGAIIDEFMRLEYGPGYETAKAFTEHMEDFYAVAQEKDPALRIPHHMDHNAAYASASTYPYTVLETAKNILAKGIEDIGNNKDLTEEEKNAAVTSLERMKLKPLRMIMKNMEYYPISQSDKNEVIDEFFAIADRLGVTEWSVGVPLSELKNEYGVL